MVLTINENRAKTAKADFIWNKVMLGFQFPAGSWLLTGKSTVPGSELVLGKVLARFGDVYQAASTTPVLRPLKE